MLPLFFCQIAKQFWLMDWRCPSVHPSFCPSVNIWLTFSFKFGICFAIQLYHLQRFLVKIEFFAAKHTCIPKTSSQDVFFATTFCGENCHTLNKILIIILQGPSKRKHTVSDDEDEDSPSPKPPLKKQSTSLSSTASSAKADVKPKLKKTKCRYLVCF